MFFNSYSALSSKLLFTVNLSKKTTMTMGFSFKLSNHLNQLFLPAKAFFCFSVKNKNFFVSIRKKKLCILHSDARIFFFFLRKRQITGKPSKSIRCEVKKGSLPITTNIIQFEQGWHLDYYFHSTNRTAIYTQVKGFVPANRCQKSWESFFFACEILLYDLIRVCTHSLTAKKKHIIHVYSSKKKKWVKLLFI